MHIAQKSNQEQKPQTLTALRFQQFLHPHLLFTVRFTNKTIIYCNCTNWAHGTTDSLIGIQGWRNTPLYQHFLPHLPLPPLSAYLLLLVLFKSLNFYHFIALNQSTKTYTSSQIPSTEVLLQYLLTWLKYITMPICNSMKLIIPSKNSSPGHTKKHICSNPSIQRSETLKFNDLT